jgi:hypothetical protein
LARRGYLLSLIVESLLKDSQSISAADLKTLGIGTSWFTGQRLELAADGLTLSSKSSADQADEVDDDVIAAAVYGLEPGELVTLEQAAKIARQQNQ